MNGILLMMAAIMRRYRSLTSLWIHIPAADRIHSSPVSSGQRLFAEHARDAAPGVLPTSVPEQLLLVLLPALARQRISFEQARKDALGNRPIKQVRVAAGGPAHSRHQRDRTAGIERDAAGTRARIGGELTMLRRTRTDGRNSPAKGCVAPAAWRRLPAASPCTQPSSRPLARPQGRGSAGRGRPS